MATSRGHKSIPLLLLPLSSVCLCHSGWVAACTPPLDFSLLKGFIGIFLHIFINCVIPWAAALSSFHTCCLQTGHSLFHNVGNIHRPPRSYKPSPLNPSSLAGVVNRWIVLALCTRPRRQHQSKGQHHLLVELKAAKQDSGVWVPALLLFSTLIVSGDCPELPSQRERGLR